jgi:hypothetical protein
LNRKLYHLQTKDYYSLLNLHKILLEAKFHPKPENECVSGSPYTAELHQEVASLLLQSEKASDWEDWLQLKNRTDYRQRAILQMKQCRQWKDAPPETKKELAKNYLAPFLYTESELEEVIAEVDRVISTNAQKSDTVFAKIEAVTDKSSFIEFLDLLAKDFATNPSEWENNTIPYFIKAMSSWITDFSDSDYNDIDWENPDYQTMAKILYMGKLYE